MFALGGPLHSFGVSIGFGVEQVVIGVWGEVDMVTAPQLGALLAVATEQARTDVVLDLARLEFMDAAGLRAIATTAVQLRPSGRGLTLRSVPAMTRRILDVTGVDNLVHIESSGPSASDVAASDVAASDVAASDVAASDGGDGSLGPEQSSGDRSTVVAGQEVDRVGLTAVASVPASDDVVDTALRLVVSLAKATVGGADGVSVSLARRGRLTTVAATDETIIQMDRDQYATAQGPCVAAATEGRWFHVDSLAAETRWPDFIPRAIEGGIGSILSTPLMVGDRPVGALNIYSTAAAAFGPSAQDLAAMFATEASGFLADAGIDVMTEELGRRLQNALHVREVIAQAQGVLMERTGVRAEEAAAALRHSALDARTTVRQRAVDVVTSTRRDSVASM